MINGQYLRFLFVTVLTLGRMPLIFLFLAINLTMGRADHAVWFSAAFAAMILSALTDLFDGYLARRWKVVTRFGGSADPVIDKIFFIITLPVLVYRAWMRGEPLWHCKVLLALAVILLARDQWLTFLREVCAKHRVETKADWIGKTRTVVLFVAICTIYWYLQAPKGWIDLSPVLIYALEAASLMLTLISIVTYTRTYGPALRGEIASVFAVRAPKPGERFARREHLALATGLTILRVPLALVFLLAQFFLTPKKTGGEWLLLEPHWHVALFVLCQAILIVCFVTNALDGFLARRLKAESDLGKYAHPLADGLYYLVTLMVFAFLAVLRGEHLGSVLLLLLATMSLVSDQWASFLKSIGAMHRMVGQATWSDRVRTVIVFPTICVIYWHLQAPGAWPVLPRAAAYALIGACLAAQLVAMLAYSVGFWPGVRREMSQQFP